MASKDTPKSEWTKHMWKSQQKWMNNTISDSANSIPKDATVVMTEYLGLVSRQKLVHEMVVITVGGTRRDVCLKGARPRGKELPDCSDVQRWRIRSAHLVENLLCLSCARESRESLSSLVLYRSSTKEILLEDFSSLLSIISEVFLLLLPRCTHIN